MAESTNKILQTILKKIVNENRTDWDNKLQSALWAYRTSFKTSIQSTPFRMAFGLEAVMPIEFQVPSLRVQVKARLPEAQSEQYRLEQLLELGEDRVESMAQLEQCQRQTGERAHYRQTGSSFSNTTRVNAGKVKISVDRSILDYRRVQRDVPTRHTCRRHC